MTVGAVVLAGGRSTRMGSPKADLDWRGIPLAAHVAGIARAATGNGPVVVVAAPGQRLPPLPRAVEHTVDAAEGRGPLQGLLAGLRHLEPRATLAVVVATDQALITAPLLHRVAQAASGADAAAFTVRDRIQPLGAAYRTGLAGLIEQRLAEDDHSLRGLLAAIRTVEIPAGTAEAAQLRGLDTPEAYEQALRSSGG